jgi:acyl-CoA synthetase (AMP-forming)/AMP-acid ligase II
MQGYYKRERAECFDADGWFHTGDSCSLDEEGFLYFHGRRTEMLKTSGANVAPREVELVLQEHEDVAEAAVVGLPHAKMGQMVVAAVTLKPDRTFDEAALRAWLAGQLSSFKVPKRILPLAAADMPRTDTGKVRKTELSARLEEMLATPA